MTGQKLWRVLSKSVLIRGIFEVQLCKEWLLRVIIFVESHYFFSVPTFFNFMILLYNKYINKPIIFKCLLQNPVTLVSSVTCSTDFLFSFQLSSFKMKLIYLLAGTFEDIFNSLTPHPLELLHGNLVSEIWPRTSKKIKRHRKLNLSIENKCHVGCACTEIPFLCSLENPLGSHQDPVEILFFEVWLFNLSTHSRVRVAG